MPLQTMTRFLTGCFVRTLSDGWSTLTIGKSAPSPPPTPSAAETAAAQSQANTNTAASQTALNNTNQYTPYGSTTYAQNGSYTNGAGDTVPTYAQTTALSPAGQNILTGTQNVEQSLMPTAQNLANQTASATTNPLNFNTADSAILNTAPDQLNKQAADAIYNQQKSYLDPQWNQQGQQLQDQLSRQGISVGSEAYGNAQTQLDNARTQAYQGAQDSAIAGGTQAASQLFGLAQAGQNQNISQQQLAQQQPLSLLSQLYGATPSTPTQPIGNTVQTGVSPTDVTGATAAANNAAMQAYQSQVATQNANVGGMASLAGTAAIAGATIF